MGTCAAMTARELARRRLVLSLALLVPPAFFGVVIATTSDRMIPIRIAAAPGRMFDVSEPRMTLLFISIAAAGLIGAFFASNLVQQHADVNRRLVLCGYTARELIGARLVVLFAIVCATGAYTWALLALVTRPPFPAGVFAAVVAGAFVHACYGLLVGATLRREIEAVFAILVLVNIDAGWLQNPVYYDSARSKWLIEALPAYFPAQASYVAAFGDGDAGGLLLRSAAYGIALLLVAVTVYAGRMRIAR